MKRTAKKEEVKPLAYIPTQLRKGRPKGKDPRPKKAWCIGNSKTVKGKGMDKIGGFYAGPFIKEVTALEEIGEQGYAIYKVTKKGKYKKEWYWSIDRWIRYITK